MNQHRGERRLPGGVASLWCLGALLAFAGGLAGCKGARPDNQKPPVVVGLNGAPAAGAFEHNKHIKLLSSAGDPCQVCHEVDAKTDLVKRPGTDNHKPCSNSGCHGPEAKDGQNHFSQPPGEFCKVCHEDINPFVEGENKMYPYPRPGRLSAVQNVVSFNHKQHLGFNQDCSSCHVVVADENVPYATLPRHKECKKCHSEGGAGAQKLPMSDCKGCHENRARPNPKRFITNGIRFTHGKHFVDNEGEISCKTCHASIWNSKSSKDRELPGMNICGDCHENRKKTRRQFRIKNNCELCHVTEDYKNVPLPENHKPYTASLDGLPEGDEALEAPRAPEADGELTREELAAAEEFLSLDEFTRGSAAVVADIGGLIPVERNVTIAAGSKRPHNHTVLFRTQHGEAASRPDAQCHNCHLGLSGTPRDSCNDCHSVWRPRNHTLRWRGVEHGRAASRKPESCNSCHQSSFCTECHNIPPPSHSPLNVFRFKHSRAARYNARSCVTCHTFETTCVECHTLDVIPFGDADAALRRAP